MNRLEELLNLESDLTNMFDSDQRVALALLEFIRNNKQELNQQAIYWNEQDQSKLLDMKTQWDNYSGLPNPSAYEEDN